MNSKKPIPPYDFRNQSKTPEPGRLADNRATKLASYQPSKDTDDDGDDDTWNLDSDAAEQTMAALRGGDVQQAETGRINNAKNAAAKDFPNSFEEGDGRSGGGGDANAKSPSRDNAKIRRNSSANAEGDGRRPSGGDEQRNNFQKSPAKHLSNGSAINRPATPPKSPFSNFTVALSEEEGSSSSDEGLEKSRRPNSASKEGRKRKGRKEEEEGEKKRETKRPLSAKLERAAKLTAASARRSIRRTFKSNSKEEDAVAQRNKYGRKGEEEEEADEDEEEYVLRRKAHAEGGFEIGATLEKRSWDPDFTDGDDDEDADGQVKISSPNKTPRPTRSSSIKNHLSTSLLPTSTSFRLLSDPLADEKLLLETRHSQSFLQTPTLDLDDMGGVHEMAAKGERRIRHLTHAGCGVARLAITLPAVFFLTCLQCLVKYVLHPIFVGVVELVVDSLAKPFVVLVFNKMFSPVLLLVFNGLRALGVALKPAFEMIREVALIVAKILSSFRLVEINYAANKRAAESEAGRRDLGAIHEI